MRKELKNRKIRLFILTILLIFSSLAFTLDLNQNERSSEISSEIQHKVNAPKLSANEINITTPENKTYYEPMEGYYPANYGFENEKNGEEPSGWTRCDSAYGTVQVVSEKQGHKKVLKVDDDAANNGEDPGISIDFSERIPNGTLELWVYKESGTLPISIELLDIASGPRYVNRLSCDRYLYTTNNRFNLNPSETWTPFGPAFNENTWYHIRIDWDVAATTVDIYINGILEADGYAFTHSDALGVDRIDIQSAWTGTGIFYVDAIGLKVGESSYNIGDNLKEGLLMSYENSTNLEAVNYSLDGQDQIPINGNTTISMPEDGPHTVQLFANDSDGLNYQSDLRHFSIDWANISIITPENKTYYEPMEGYYPANYGFENEKNGEEPSGWTRCDSAYGTVQVVSEKQGHKKVLKVDDDAANNGEDPGISIDFSERIPNGTLELWVYKESGTLPISIELLDIASGPRYVNRLSCDRYLYTTNNRFNLNPSETWTPFGPAFNENTWYHIRIDWDVAATTVDIYINGILEADGYAFTHSDALGVDRIDIQSAWTGTGIFYVDAIGLKVGESSYNIGDNLKEGLLMSYENSTNLEAVNYSLDGQEQIPIDGNITIPMPEDGPHTIQVFANNTDGIDYQSEKIYFTIAQDTTPPQFRQFPNDYSIMQGNQSTFSWKIIEDNPMNYSLHRNGTLIKRGVYKNDTEITYGPFVNWTLGSLEFRIEANDTAGNSHEQTFTINITERTDGYHFIEPNRAFILNLTKFPEHVYITANLSDIGFLTVERRQMNFEAEEIWANMSALYYYRFELYNRDFQKDQTILNSLKIRFYYEEGEVGDESDLYILHFLGHLGPIWFLETESLIRNTTQNYVEIELSELSSFCLAELEILSDDDDDDKDEEDSGPSFLIFFENGLIIIIILSAVGVSFSAGYIITRKKREKKGKKEKKTSEAYDDLEEKSKEKRAQLEKRMWKPNEKKLETPKELKKIPRTPTAVKAKKAIPKKKYKIEEKPISKELTEEERQEIEKTESEMAISQDFDKCTVHKGKIQGITYVCPKCQAKYCFKCAQTLSNKKEKCWVCGSSIELSGEGFQENIEPLDMVPGDGEEKILNLLSKDNKLEDIRQLNELNITALSQSFLDKVERIEMEERDKKIFLKEMVSLTPEEREEIINRMLKSKGEDFKG